MIGLGSTIEQIVREVAKIKDCATEGKVTEIVDDILKEQSVIRVAGTGNNGLVELGTYSDSYIPLKNMLYKRDPDSGDALSFEDVFVTKEELMGSGGSNDAFIYVDELPTENIIESGLYRLNAKTVLAGQVGSLTTDGTTIPTKVIVTSERPAVGEMYLDTVNFQLVTYLDLSDGKAYVYAPEAGWILTTDLLSTVAGISVGYGGIISSESEATNNMALYIIYDGNIYQHTDGSWGELGQSTGGVTEDRVNEIVTDAINENFGQLSPVAITGSYYDLSDAPTVSAVAESGSYNDLTDKPVIPTEDDILGSIEMKLSSNDEGYARDDLDTESKTIVGAINEINAKAGGGGGGKLYAHRIRAVFRTTSIPVTTTSGYFYVYSLKDVLSIEKTYTSLATFLAAYNGLCFYVTSSGSKTVYIVHGTDSTGVINMTSLADNTTKSFTSSSHTISSVSVVTTEL